MTPAVRTEGLTKDFGSLRAVDHLDLEVHRGEVFGYLGPNGSGKTTTIRMLLDILRPTSGRAAVLGGSGADPAVRRRIGYLPGELRFDPRYTASDLFGFFGRLRGGVDPRLLDALVQRLDLDPTRPIGQLSSGNKRKVAIVQAFMHAPDLLILDEPTSGLDPLLQHEFQKLVRQVVSVGTTVFLSSHVLPEVEVLADRVGILRRGRLLKVASVDELRAQARQRIDLFVADADPTRFLRIPEVVEAQEDDGIIRLLVEGSVDRVLKAAAKIRVERIVTHETDLEDVFLDMYRQG